MSSAPVAEHAAAILRQRDECAGIPPVREPLEPVEERRPLVAQAGQPVLQTAGLVGPAVDLLDAAVALDQLEQRVHQGVVRRYEEVVHDGEVVRRHREPLSHVVPHVHETPPGRSCAAAHVKTVILRYKEMITARSPVGQRKDRRSTVYSGISSGGSATDLMTGRMMCGAEARRASCAAGRPVRQLRRRRTCTAGRQR